LTFNFRIKSIKQNIGAVSLRKTCNCKQQHKRYDAVFEYFIFHKFWFCISLAVYSGLVLNTLPILI
jgi:hypothetical protein